MSDYPRPTRSELISRIKGDINSRMSGADSRLRRNWLNALATAHGGAMDGAYGYLDSIANNIFPWSADLKHLTAWATYWGVTPKAASLAGPGSATGTGTNGFNVPINTVLQRADNFDYVTTAAATVVGGVVTVPFQATKPGSIGSADAGVQLELIAPIAGINGTFTIAGDGVAGSDAETAPELLARLEERIQNPPKAGGPGDYVNWALSQAGVTRAWEYPRWMGLGTVGVTWVYDDRVNIIPTAGDVAAMQAFLQTVAPVTAAIFAFAPTPLVTAFSIALTPSNSVTQAAVEAQLQEFFTENATPGGTLLRSQYDDAVDLTPGVADYNVAIPAGNIVATPGELAILGAITWL